MRDTKELIAQLRAGKVSYFEKKAADALESLTQQLAERDAEVAHIKEVEFPRKVEAVAAGWKLKCDALQAQLAAAKGKVDPRLNHLQSIVIDMYCDWKKGDFALPKLAQIDLEACFEAANCGELFAATPTAQQPAQQAQPEPVTYTPPKIIDPDAPHPCFN